RSTVLLTPGRHHPPSAGPPGTQGRLQQPPPPAQGCVERVTGAGRVMGAGARDGAGHVSPGRPPCPTPLAPTAGSLPGEILLSAQEGGAAPGRTDAPTAKGGRGGGKRRGAGRTYGSAVPRAQDLRPGAPATRRQRTGRPCRAPRRGIAARDLRPRA